MTATERAGGRPNRNPAAAGERRGLGLGTRIFLMTALLIALAVGGAVAFTAFTAQRIAHEQASEALEAGGEVLRTVRGEHADGLLRETSLVASDPAFASYVSEAIFAGDSTSTLDLLAQRQADLDFRFAAVLDPYGQVVARTDRPSGGGEDLSDRPLVARALEEFVASGLWREGDELYDAAVVPIDPGGVLAGFLLAGFDLGLQQVMGNDVAVLAEREGRPSVAAGTLGADRGRQLAAAVAERQGLLARVAGEGETVGGVELSLGGEPWLARLVPLADADGEPVAAAAVLVSLDRELAPFRAIQRALLAAGLAAVLLAFALSYGFGRRVLAPIRRLAAAALAAREGDYDQTIPTERGDEVGALARSFDHLLSDLREKRDMEAYVAELSRNLPDSPATAPAAHSAPRPVVRERLALLTAEFRDRARLAGQPGESLAALGRDLRRLGELATARGGRLEAVAGHRAWVSFRGDARCQRALGTAADLLTATGRSLDAPAVAIAEGPAEAGTVGDDGAARPALAGPPVQQLEGLAREAGPGDVVFDRRVFDELADGFERAGVELIERRGVLTPQPLYLIGPEEAVRVTEGLPAPVAFTTPGAPRRGDRETLSQIRPGAVVGGRFEILALLGMGGMGVVFKARDRELDDLVALKMLRADRGIGAEEIERLKDELRLARRITHPNVLRTYDLGMVDGVPFISMEYVRGVTLRYLLDQTDRLPYSAGLRLARQLCHGLAAAHEVGVVHRDIKPENLILEPNGNAKLMDFGIARRLSRPDPGVDTASGHVIGTPHYLAPEQLRGDEATPRSDIYSAGVLLYELFTGDLPFAARTAREAVKAALEQEPTPASEHWPEIPPDLERILSTCLAKDPARRFAGAPDLLRRLDALRA